MDPYRKVSLRWMQIVLLVVLSIADRSDALQEGDACTHLGQEGVCTASSGCTLRTNERKTLCGYAPHAAIICCPNFQIMRSMSEPSGQPHPKPTVLSLPQTQPFAQPQPKPSVIPQWTPSDDTDSRSSLRKSVQKCNGYKNLTTDRVSVGSLSMFRRLVKVDVPKCQMTVKLIIGGSVTKPGEFPHMGVIGWRIPGGGYAFHCGGSLISESYVLTAAHCYFKSEEGILPSIVRLGEQNLVRADDGAQPEDYDIRRFIQHLEYRGNESRYNDLALVQLTTTVKYNAFIRPACLAQSDTLRNATVIATGYGLTHTFGPRSDNLRKVRLTVYNNTQCSKGYRRERLARQGIKSTQMCVGDENGGRDTCQGDSGGPLQVSYDENQCLYHIIGVTSFGRDCGSKIPSLYTRVSSYLDWIEPIVWPQM